MEIKRKIKLDSKIEYVHDTNDKVQKKSSCDIRVMTYNVHGFKNRANQKKFQEILNVIREINPDILVIEEVYIYRRNETITDTDLANELNKFGLMYSAFSSNGVNGIFSKNYFDYTEIDLGKDPKFKISRNALLCKFDSMYFIGTHLDVFDESGLLRKQQMKLIMNELNEFDDSDRVIVAGDFNSLRKEDYSKEEWNEIALRDKKRNVSTITDAIPIIEQAGFIDSFLSCDKINNLSVWSNRRVDYIYGKNINFTKSFTYKNTYSDHYPIYADFK